MSKVTKAFNLRQHTETLRHLAEELFLSDEWQILQQLCKTSPINYPQINSFDQSLGGPSILGVSCRGWGRYEAQDRDVFRPLQYCAVHFHPAYKKYDIEWATRDVIEMSSLHLESLIKRIGKVWHLPLGQALRNAVVKAKVDPVTWGQISRYTRIYNDAKHNFNHNKDTHMFSVEDALLAYFVCRKLGKKLYPLASLSTDLSVFDTNCDETGFDPSTDPNAYPSK